MRASLRAEGLHRLRCAQACGIGGAPQRRRITVRRETSVSGGRRGQRSVPGSRAAQSVGRRTAERLIPPARVSLELPGGSGMRGAESPGGRGMSVQCPQRGSLSPDALKRGSSVPQESSSGAPQQPWPAHSIATWPSSAMHRTGPVIWRPAGTRKQTAVWRISAICSSRGIPGFEPRSSESRTYIFSVSRW